MEPLGTEKLFDTSWSDDLAKEVIQLGPKVVTEAWPEEIFLLGQALDLPGRVFGQLEGDVAFVAPLAIVRQVVGQDGCDLSSVVAIADPIERAALIARQFKPVHGKPPMGMSVWDVR